MKIKETTCKLFLKALTKKKYYVLDEESQLKKSLNTFDLTTLGVGSTLGVGVYVLAGEVAKNYAGPSVVISFLIAAIASTLAGLCYAEFGVRVPKAGSAYEYSYVCIGEFIAFMVGWNLILEYVIGSASVVKGLFTYLDALTWHVMSEFFREHMPMNISIFAPFPDFFSLGVILIFSIALALGAKESLIVNNIFTVVNIAVVLFVIISGFWKVDIANWRIPKDELPSDEYGEGGFAPYGAYGVLTGAATCFYGFIGFACIATAGEEAKTPQKSIPIAVTVSLFIVFFAYFGISTVITMMLPYYDQDDQAPLPHVYDTIGWDVAKYLVSVGALCGLLSSLLGSMFPLPRVIYAMATDGLLFAFLGKIHPKFKTPLIGTLFAGLVTGILACVFQLSDLFKMMAVGTLVAYSIVAACVLILKYKEINKKYEREVVTASSVCYQLFNRKLDAPTWLSCRIVAWAVILFTIFSFLLAAFMTQFMEEMINGVPWVIAVLASCCFMIILTVTSMACQPKSPEKLVFAVPFVPYLPACSMMINIFLMVLLDVLTWARYAVWMGVGLLIYFCYGVWNSKILGRDRSSLATIEENKEKS